MTVTEQRDACMDESCEVVAFLRENYHTLEAAYRVTIIHALDDLVAHYCKLEDQRLAESRESWAT